jgi:predicted metal-dependent phosphoesterase TrpH
MPADLHTHSVRSDGMLAPAELVRQAAMAGLNGLALTDHDSVAGIDEARAAALTFGIELVVGVELSVRDQHGVDDHLLGYFVEPEAQALQDWLRRLQADRQRMAERIIGELERLGVPIRRERVAELAAGAVVTRPHIARALVEAGHAATEQEAFDRYLGAGKPAAPKRPSADPSLAIQTIRAANGVACLAHPVFCQDADAQQRLRELPQRLDHLVAVGLQALECFYPDATPDATDQLVRMARERGLIATGGSDFHGPGKAPNAPLGACAVEYEVVETLRSARPGPPVSHT